MSRYWAVNLTTAHFRPPVRVVAVLVREVVFDEPIPDTREFVDASSSFDLSKFDSRISFDEVYLFIGTLPVAGLVEGESVGRKYWLIPVRPAT